MLFCSENRFFVADSSKFDAILESIVHRFCLFSPGFFVEVLRYAWNYCVPVVRRQLLVFFWLCRKRSICTSSRKRRCKLRAVLSLSLSYTHALRKYPWRSRFTCAFPGIGMLQSHTHTHTHRHVSLSKHKPRAEITKSCRACHAHIKFHRWQALKTAGEVRAVFDGLRCLVRPSACAREYQGQNATQSSLGISQQRCHAFSPLLL